MDIHVYCNISSFITYKGFWVFLMSLYIQHIPINPDLAVFPSLGCVLLVAGQDGKVLILGDPHSRSLEPPPPI